MSVLKGNSQCQGKNVDVFVYEYVIFFLFKANKCNVLLSSFSLLLHQFENFISRQSVEKDFAQKFLTIHYVQIKWKVNKSSSLLLNDAIRKYSFVLRHKMRIIRLTEFSFSILFDDVMVSTLKSLCKRWRANLFNRTRLKIPSCLLFIEIVFD